MEDMAQRIAARVLAARDAVAKGNSLCLCASQHFLDTLACLIVGTRVGTYNGLVESTEASGPVPIPGTDQKFSRTDAGAIVGYLINSSVYEDGSRYGACHPAAGVFPALWASGQEASLFELMQAMAGGYEAMVDVAAIGNPSFTQRGFHPTGLCAPFGAAAAAGILLKFDEEKLVKALTLATSGSCGLMHSFKEESTQPLHVSHAVRAGLIAALMANHGLSGERKIFEEGFYPAYLGQKPPEEISHYFINGWAIENAYLKPYPGCRHLHPALDAMDQIIKKSTILFEEIDSIKVETYRVAVDTEIHTVRSRGDAYFNVAYALSVRIILGRADWDAFDTRHLGNPKMKELMSRVQISVEEQIDKAYPKERGARVTLGLKSGKTFTALQRLPKGEPELPISFEETAEKFRLEAKEFLTKDETDGIVNQAFELGGPASEIFRILSGPFKRRNN